MSWSLSQTWWSGCYSNSETIVPSSSSSSRAWSLGEVNSHLSYYNGLIQLNYSNGSQYNDDRHTARSTLISFLCDPDVGAGQPEFRVKKSIFFLNCAWINSYFACNSLVSPTFIPG